MAQILSNLARPMQSSTVSQAIPLEDRSNTLDDFFVSQKDFDVMLGGKVLQRGITSHGILREFLHKLGFLQQAEGVTLIECTDSRY